MNTTVEGWRELMAGYSIPPYMTEGLARWIVDGVKPGSFLQAVLANDLVGAVSKADGINRKTLSLYVDFLINVAPSRCWGSQAVLQEWKGLTHESTLNNHSA